MDSDISYTNYITYIDPSTSLRRVGHLSFLSNTIQPLSFPSGTRISDLYQLISLTSDVPSSPNPIPSGPPTSLSSVHILPPLPARDVLCIGKNYFAHAREFNTSGFDSSDHTDIPSHPVVFTKRYTSIIAHGEEILPHPDFTSTLDYEGEIGVIIGKAGFRIGEEEAMDHVWGYTIVNDVTARERQRDHKQFYLGKSVDGGCPMGPIAVPASQLDKVLRVQTHVNGELRQDATTEDLIFSIPYLIKTMSEGQTLMPGDVIATGTPAGVGIGRSPPIYLKPGDTISVSVSGLGTLTNRVASASQPNPTLARLEAVSHIHPTTPPTSLHNFSLTLINNKPLSYTSLGPSTGPPLIFIPGLGSTSTFFLPLIHTLSLDLSHSLHLIDLEGQGQSPTHPLSTITIPSLAEDIDALFSHAHIPHGATIIAHSLGCLAAVHFALQYPEKVSKVVLLSPPPSSLPDAVKHALLVRSDRVRDKGMSAVPFTLSKDTASTRPRAAANPAPHPSILLSLLSASHNAEGYAKLCTALANSPTLPYNQLKAQTLVVAGGKDGLASPDACKKLVVEGLRGNAGLEIVEGAGEWCLFEDLEGVVGAVRGFVQGK